MSTRRTIVLAEDDAADMHLYHEMVDGRHHLEIEGHDGQGPHSVDIVLPEPLVAGVAAILRRAAGETGERGTLPSAVRPASGRPGGSGG